MLPQPEFRAPPPSPVAGAHAHGREPPDDYDDDDDCDEFAGFLSHSLRVPTLSLPHRIFPKEATAWHSPEIDFSRLIFPKEEEDDARLGGELLRSAAAAFGCFQLVNHGIPTELVAAVGAAAISAFQIPPDKKAKAARSPERRWGFEVEEEGEGEEFLWWCKDGLRYNQELAGILAESYSDLRDNVEGLWKGIEKIARRIERVLVGDGNMKPGRDEDGDGSLLCLHKHAPNASRDGGIKHELLRMLVRSWRCSCSLSVHLPGGASEFHVYSKRGWYRFRPDDAAVIVTVGDQIQACSGGLYKHVIGKPVLKEGDRHDSISMAFHYTTRPAIRQQILQEEKTISLAEQIMAAACLAILYHILAFFYGSK